MGQGVGERGVVMTGSASEGGADCEIVYLSVDPVTSSVGSSQVVADVCRIAERGFPVHLHSFEHEIDPNVASNLERAGVRWTAHRYGSPGARGGLSRVVRLAASLRGSDLVHARSDMAAAAALLAGVDRWVWDVRSLWAEQKIATGVFAARSLQARIFRQIERAAAHRADKVVTLTTEVIDVLDARYGGVVKPKAMVVTTCVDRDRFRLAVPPSGKPLRVLLAGTLNRFYDVPSMLDLVHELRSRRPTEFVVAAPGSTDWDEELDGAGAIRINVASGEMPGLVASCHLGLSVCRDDAGISLTAAMPTKIGEFLAVGRPVVVNPGLTDAAGMLESTATGIVYGSDSPNVALAVDRLLELVDDPATSLRAAQLAEQHFDLETGVDRLVRAYRSLMADG